MPTDDLTPLVAAACERWLSMTPEQGRCWWATGCKHHGHIVAEAVLQRRLCDAIRAKGYVVEHAANVHGVGCHIIQFGETVREWRRAGPDYLTATLRAAAEVPHGD